jgi:hypothetical protein
MARSVLIFAPAIFTLASCASFGPDICHNNFKSLHRKNIGKSTNDESNWFKRYRHRFEEFQTLPNGNIEYVIKGLRSCRSFYEVDTQSQTVVAWRFDGAQKDCIICP